MIHGKCSALSASFFQNKISVIYEITKKMCLPLLLPLCLDEDLWINADNLTVYPARQVRLFLLGDCDDSLKGTLLS